jgi:hypothetical protein
MALRNEFKNFTEIYSAVATNAPVVFYGGHHPPKKQTHHGHMGSRRFFMTSNVVKDMLTMGTTRM